MKTKIAAVCFVVLMAFLLATTSSLRAASAYPTYNDNFLLYDKGRAPIQVFAPRPSLSSTTSIGVGATLVVDCTGWIALRWYATGELRRSLNDNTSYYRAREELLGIDPDVESVTFTNATGSAIYIDIEGM